MNDKDMLKLYFRLKEDYLLVFGDNSKRISMNPIKTVNVLTRQMGVATERLTYLSAQTTNGYYGIKEIYVNDETGEYEESVSVWRHNKHITFLNKGITTLRCGAMTAAAIYIMNQVMGLKIKKVGFIGNGRTNLMNARFIKLVFGVEHFVIRGSHKDLAKNEQLFSEIAQTEVDGYDDLRLLNECDVVVVTTSNYEREFMYSTEQLSKPKLIIVLDCGYTLDESFRKECQSFTDYPEQLEHEYRDEFVFDTDHYEMHNLAHYYMAEEGGSVCVYLHGIGFADITTTEMVMTGEITL